MMERHQKAATRKAFPRTNVWQQYYATIIANLVALSQGCAIGWLSPALPQLISDKTPLLYRPSTSTVSWIGSISSLGAIAGAMSFCFFVARVGAKRSVLFLCIPFCCVWLLIYFGNTVTYVLCARFIGGFAGGATDILILFVSEIVNDEIRGRLGTFQMFFRNVGVLVAFILGAHVDYYLIPCINIVVPIVFGIAFALLPNTPRYHLQRGQSEKAENALKFYKGYKGGDPQEEIAFRNELERLKTIVNEQKTEEKFAITDICNRAAIKGIAIGIALMTCVVFTGTFLITSYAVITFQKAGTSINPYTSSIMLAVAMIFGSLASTSLADILGRRKLNLISMFGAASGFSGTALYHYLNLNGYDLSSCAWIPVVCLCFVIFISTAGILSLAGVCCVENLQPKIRTVGMAIIYTANNLFHLPSLKTYPILLESIDLHGCLMIYACGCFIGFIFILFALKETTGRSLDGVGVDMNAETKATPAKISNSI